MSNNNYWKAHFVINPNAQSFQNINYHSCGICEVHYENDKPVAWSAEYQTLSATDEDINTAINESQGLMKLYMRALTECVYIVRKKDDGSEFLEVYRKRFE